MNFEISKGVAITIAIIVLIGAIGGLYALSTQSKTVLKIFTAGSLSEPFGNMESGEDMKSIFERNHPGVTVQVSSGGSAYMIRKVTEFGQECDILASSDYSIIASMMINETPKTADFVIEFARNSMVLTYTANSAYHEEINSSNWFDILRKEDVIFGFANPNHDPGGYRAQMTILLSELHYGDDTIYDDLVLSNTNMISLEYDEENDTYDIQVPSDFQSIDSGKVMIRDAEVDLTSILETGSIDYLFIYESVARRHATSGELFLELPREINLNDTAFASTYAKVSVTQFADSDDDSKIKKITAKPIVYGITIPHTVRHPELAIEFLNMVLTNAGQDVMSNAGQQPIVPGHAGYWRDEVPEGIRELVS